jgi:ring-1,2-phenylacetyl-CoA epoxidase subunit PaaE
MARFHTLTVTDIQRTIRDAVVVTLEPENPDAFDFIPGQHLTFRRDFDGQELRRSYSICAGKGEGILQVAIKRVDGGTFSTWANEALSVGDHLQAMAPTGRFYPVLEPDNAHDYLGFAGGSGITPVLSILKTVLQVEPLSTFTLVYANRAISTIMFREELEDLKNLYMGRLTIIHVLESDSQEIDLFTGRIDEEKCALLFQNWIDIGSVDTAFICGPEPMMLGITRALQAHGLDNRQIKFELFKSDQPGRAARKARSVTAANTKPAQARITLEGTTRTIRMERDSSILEAALQNDLDVPFSCRAGVCATCRARLIKGEVDMIANHALEDYEVERGYILTCQCYPTSDAVVVDYDQ